MVGTTVDRVGVTVAIVVDVGETGRVNVAIGDAVGVALTRGVTDGVIDAVGVIKSGLPNSLHPRSGAMPAKPVRGVGGISSPFFATYCVTPLSIAGEPDRSTRPLKSSSTVRHAPSGPGFGAA